MEKGNNCKTLRKKGITALKLILKVMNINFVNFINYFKYDNTFNNFLVNLNRN